MCAVMGLQHQDFDSCYSPDDDNDKSHQFLINFFGATREIGDIDQSAVVQVQEEAISHFKLHLNDMLQFCCKFENLNFF